MNETFILLSTHSPNLVGFILPPIIEVLNKDIAADKMMTFRFWKLSFEVEEKFMATLAICLSAAAILNAQNLAVGNMEQAIASFGIIFTESQAVYRLYFKDSWLRDKIQNTVKTEDPQLETPSLG
jgi:hypothetical protein